MKITASPTVSEIYTQWSL